MSSLLLLLCICLSICLASNILLSPNAMSISNSSFVSILKNASVNSNPDAWQIIPQNQIGFHLSLTLSNQYSFHPINPSLITIQFQTINTSIFNPLLLSISQSNTLYISTILPFINDIAYPPCDSTPPYTQTFATGNIKQLLSINNSQTRIFKATNNTYSDDDIQLDTNQTNHTLLSMSDPSLYTVSLKYTPSNDSLLVNSECGYSYIASQSPLTIFLAATEILSEFNIASINVTHQILPIPTSSPTDGGVVIVGPDDDTSTTSDSVTRISDTTNVSDADSVEEQATSNPLKAQKEDNLVLLILSGVLGIAIVLSILEIIHSKLQGGLCHCKSLGFHRSDQMQYGPILLYAFSVCNIVTDIYISYRACIYFFNTKATDLAVLIVAICSFVFIIIPYCINILAMTRIFNLKCKSNGPQKWFEKHLVFFFLLEFLSCDSYICIKLVKSNIFGMELFNSGHSSIELKKVRATKKATILTQVCHIAFILLFDHHLMFRCDQ